VGVSESGEFTLAAIINILARGQCCLLLDSISVSAPEPRSHRAKDPSAWTDSCFVSFADVRR